MSLFITFEGPEGSGKTTVAYSLVNQLEKDGYKVIYTREPGGIDIAEQIRSVILNTENTKMDQITEALLYAAARRQHLVERVIPALKEGYIVICDRFVDSSLTYQGYARGIGMDTIYQINQYAIDGWMPKLTILFDIDPLEGLKRIQVDKHREINRLDLEDEAFHQKVREGYRIVADMYPDRIQMIDASQSISTVYEEVYSIVCGALKNE